MEQLSERWWRRRQTSAFRTAPAFTDAGLVLGHGTRLLQFDRMVRPALEPADHDRLLTLLAVAGKGRVPERAADDIVFAADQWRRGDRALAAIRLAFAPLPRLAGLDDAYPLFLAEIALDAGLTPRDLLAELGYGGSVAPLLKGSVDQPRVPAGSGRASGRWTSGEATVPDAAGATTGRSAVVGSGSRRAPFDIVPVFLSPEHDGEDEVADKPVPFRSEPIGEAIQHGHELDLLMPRGGGLPLPIPWFMDQPQPRSEDDDKDGPACPSMQDDVAHGASDAAKRFEAMIARLVNPSDPTPKNTPDTPDVRSQAYFLPQPGMSGGKVSYDDCKRTNEPSPAIPEMKRGDMADARNEGRSFVYYYPSTKGFDEFRDQVLSQDAAVGLDGRGRRVFQCVGTGRDATYLTGEFRGWVKHTFFKACHL